jgi:hypothetical protein
MALPAGRTLFKKKDGILTLTPDQHGVRRVREMMASHAPIHTP